MNKIKKTILTLVALLAVTAGAWAQGPWTSGACTVTLSGDVMTVSGTGAMEDYLDTNFTPWYGYTSDIKTIVIESGVTGIGNFAFSRFEKLESVSIPASVTSIGKSALGECGTEATTALTVSFAEGSAPLTIGEVAFRYANLKSFDIPNRVTSIGSQAFYNCSNLESVSIPASVTSIGDYAFYYCGMLAKVYIYAPSLTTYGSAAFADNASGRKIHVLSDAVDTYKAGWPDYAADFVGDLQPLASGPEVAWNKAEKTGSFTMPGGNVTLEPDYYPQATAAEGAVTAATDAKATTDAPLVTIDETKLTGATKMMYYVSTDATAPAYDAEGWTDVLPTAEKFTEAANLNVWYYPVGTDEGVGEATATYSDGDMNATALTVTIATAPLWNAEFDLTNAPEEDIPEGGVVKGTEVKVTYTGTKKVIGVKAEKKAAPAAAEGHALSASAVGEIVGTDGKAYAVADKDNLPEGVTAVAMVAYKSATAGSSLAIALADQGSMRWSTAKSQCAGKTAIGGKSWKLPSQGEWKQMFSANGDNEGQYTGLNTAITNAGGTALASTLYWSSSSAPAPDDDYDERAWAVNLGGGGASWESTDPAYYKQVRACLAF